MARAAATFGLACGLASAAFGAATGARAGETGAVVGLPPRADVTFGRPDGQGGWEALAPAVEMTGETVRHLFPARTARRQAGDGRWVSWPVAAATGVASVAFVRLPPGHYGIIRMVSVDVWSRTTTGGPILKPRSDGRGAIYAYALVEFDVLPGRVTNAGALMGGEIVAIADDVASRAAGRGGLAVVRRPMAITR